MVTVVDATIETIRNMLIEFNENINKCNNKDVLNFAKNIGEEFSFARDQLSSTTAIGSFKKLELGEDILKLENEFGEINEKFNKCICRQ